MRRIEPVDTGQLDGRHKLLPLRHSTGSMCVRLAGTNLLIHSYPIVHQSLTSKWPHSFCEIVLMTLTWKCQTKFAVSSRDIPGLDRSLYHVGHEPAQHDDNQHMVGQARLVHQCCPKPLQSQVTTPMHLRRSTVPRSNTPNCNLLSKQTDRGQRTVV